MTESQNGNYIADLKKAVDKSNIPAALLSSDGEIISICEDADLLRKVVFQSEAVLYLVKLAIENEKVIHNVINIDVSDNTLHYEVNLIPDNENKAVFVSVKDVTLDVNLKNVLMESRKRYKDFVETSSDFAWETDDKGNFVFVSPKGALGYDAHTLIEIAPFELLKDKPEDKLSTVFSARNPVDNLEITVLTKEEKQAYLLISAMPLHDASANWCGARGVCRDVTDIRERDNAIARAHERERLLSFIVKSFRDEVETDKMLQAAVSAAAKGIDTAGCQIFRMKEPDRRKAGLSMPGFEVTTEYGETGGKDIVLMVLSELATKNDILEISMGGWEIIASATNYNRKINGALCLWRKTGSEEWSDDNRLLVSDIAAQVGIAIEQIAKHEYIYSLSRTDALTGLFNRRAFFDEAERRFKRLKYEEKPFSLMYVDLDNFKQVNDIHGHQKGDEALLALCEILLWHTRPTDIIARLGGDEFAIWLENADRDAAVTRAKDLLEESKRLLKYSGSDEFPLGFSIGIAVNDGDKKETLKDIISRADGAMYKSKRNGKGSYVIAEQQADGGSNA